MPLLEHPWNCLVTGATGFLGRHVADQLGQSGHQVTALVRSPCPDFPDAIVGDLTESVSLDGPVDAVFHIAGKAHVVPRTAAEEQEFFDVNELGTKRLIENLGSLPELPRYFALISTVAVYGREQGEMLTESTPTEPTTPYGQSKLAAEKIVTGWCCENDVRPTILRLPLISGVAAPGNLRAMVRAIVKGHYLGIGDGSARRSVVRATDVAEVLPRIMPIGGTYHLTDRHNPSLMELERAICTALGKPMPRRLPPAVAHLAGWAGDLAQKLGVRLPINSDRVSKLTNTYTFSDESIRKQIDWEPGRVIDHIQELLD